ncbi:hypothetical protein GCM10022399_43340 [Terrabacter ginsenosidimutans]|jgi:hypothetical protein|uniref:Uncharacterized protein n=1 Tax=Terrabacter ginsenosidimutans TaxID=490575 RepID=A0ABP7EQ45_9MICO
MPRFSSEPPVRATVTPSRLNATPTIVLTAGHRFGCSGPPVLYVGQGGGDGWRDAPRAGTLAVGEVPGPPLQEQPGNP